jgi:hypothetical protein
VALLAALAIASLSYGMYAYATALPAPTISSHPFNPTNQTSATFTYTDSSSITRFECSLDSSTFTACGTTRPSTKTYPGPLSAAAHTFKVRAVSGSQTSSATSFTWTIDTTSPTVLSINRLGATPTNASSVSWTVTFSESVTGVDAGDFSLVKGGGLGGSPAITSVSGSGSVYTVTASTGSGAGTLELNLVDNRSIKDLAGNQLGPGTNGSFTGQVYSIDKIPPPAPVITQHPPNPSPSAVSTFAWTDSEAGVTFECSRENGSFVPCSSPITFTVGTTNNGEHQFDVRAVDAAGNRSGLADFKWKVSNDVFSIAGNVCCLYPGVWRSIAVALTNPNGYAIQVNQLMVGLASMPPGCQPSWIAFQQSPISTSHTVTVPANSTVNLAPVDQPQIQLIESGTNQDLCKSKTFTLQYAGSGIH